LGICDSCDKLVLDVLHETRWISVGVLDVAEWTWHVNWSLDHIRSFEIRACMGMGIWVRIGKRIAPQHESSCFCMEFGVCYWDYAMICSIALHEAMKLYSLLLHHTDCSSNVQRKASHKVLLHSYHILLLQMIQPFPRL
jgi:hypothetical protein